MSQQHHSRPQRSGPIPEPLAALRAAFDSCLLKDRYPLQRRWQHLLDRARRGQDYDAELTRLRAQLEASCTAVTLRAQQLPAIRYPEELPISARRADIAEA